MVARGVQGQSGGGIVFRVHREGNELHAGNCGLLHLAHQGTHARAGARAGGEDEIGDPDFSIQGRAVERTSGLGDQLEAGDLSVDGEPRLSGGASAEDEERGDSQDFHARLLELFWFASAADAASSTIPNATVTARLVASPGDPSGTPGMSRLLSSAVA